jgi:hypothetical protein
LIEGKPAARAGDSCTCVGEPDIIITGSLDVFIGGMPAARVGDRTAHGGVVVSGSGTVWIGESTVHIFLKDPDKKDKPNSAFEEPSAEEKIIVINQAIQECITLLEWKLILMESDDPCAKMQFEKWFGRVDKDAVEMILNRTRRALIISKTLTNHNFGIIVNEHTRRDSFAFVRSWDEFHDFYLGDLFWKDEKSTGQTKAMVIIHELSHFEDVGNTDDFEYGTLQCLDLAINYPSKALYNAESYMYFVIE